MTERKEAQAQLERALAVEREATRRLRSLDEMKNTFLAAVSHDLRTPLAAILGLAITLERGDVKLDEADARDLAGRIASNARRLERLVSNLLDMDRLERGIVTPTLEDADIGALVGRVVEESELLASDRLVTDLPSIVRSVDVAKAERIVENLLANAARHAPPSATVWVRVLEEPGGVVIAVEDDGPGVPDEIRDAVFEPFTQGPMRHAIPRSGGGADPRAAVRRTAERTGVGAGSRRRRRVVPRVPSVVAARRELGDSTARDRGRYSPAVNARSAMSIAPERVRSNLIAIRVTFVRSIPENRSRGNRAAAAARAPRTGGARSGSGTRPRRRPPPPPRRRSRRRARG